MLQKYYKKITELIKHDRLFYYVKKGELNMRKWTKETAQTYIKYAKEKGLTYWSAVDYLKHHKTMHSIV